MKCRVCDSQTEEILDLGEQTLPFGEKKYPLVLVKCPDCHLVQLRDTVPQDLMYNDDYGYRSGINETIKADLKDIADKAKQVVPSKFPDYVTTVLDIGSNDGTLLAHFKEWGWAVGVEPVKKLADESQKKLGKSAGIVNDYFSFEAVAAVIGGRLSKVDIITVISCFYDMPDPNKFVADLKRTLSSDGVIIVQQNYLLKMLENNAYDNICHEHLEYYSLLSLENLLKRHDLEVFRVEQNSINGGSFRTYISHRGSRSVEPSVAEMRESEQHLTADTYQDFVNNVLKTKLLLKANLAGLKKVYAYGASTRGSVIVQYADIAHRIDAVVERNPDKIGKKYFSIPIISEGEAKKNPPDYKLILPWFHESIVEREKGDIPLILPLPEVKVV